VFEASFDSRTVRFLSVIKEPQCFVTASIDNTDERNVVFADAQKSRNIFDFTDI